MAFRRLTGPRMPVDGLETHQTHQPPDTFPVDLMVLTFHPGGYLACPIERCGQVLTVDQLHKSEILLRYSNWLVVHTGAADIQQGALTYH